MSLSWADLNFWKSKQHKEVLSRILKDVDKHFVLPSPTTRYSAFEATPFYKVKCAILGQDPYPTRGHAHGLAFSVLPSVSPLPRSLRNIFREYSTDLGYPIPSSGSLLAWANRGVLLLNTCLTVREGEPGSHQNWGWEKLTIEVLSKLSQEKEDNLAFIFWGKNAQQYSSLIGERHLIIEAPHPSPLSARKGFFGHRPFTRVNEFLAEPIDWRL